MEEIVSIVHSKEAQFRETLAEYKKMLHEKDAEIVLLKEKVDYCESMGLSFGIMKTSNRPEGFLQHYWEPFSDHERMFRDWTETMCQTRNVVKDCIAICTSWSDPANPEDPAAGAASEIKAKYSEFAK